MELLSPNQWAANLPDPAKVDRVRMKLLLSGNTIFAALGREGYRGIREELNWSQNNNSSRNIKHKRLIPLHSFSPKRVRGAV